MISEIQSDVQAVPSTASSPKNAQVVHVSQVNRASADFSEDKVAPTKSIDSEQYKPKLKLLSEHLNEEMKRIGTDINFSYNDEIKGLIVSVKDASGDKVLREIPTKEAVELMQRMREIVGIIFDKKG
ncbi:FlaG family protein [Helicobacter cetorum]|uniref:FlaG family protein n=1 Tax=Helicobacter cetorum TaxID=138563 RepID=UPI000CF02C9D|nr:FlaG family protein [Helicobacter cetorum]